MNYKNFSTANWTDDNILSMSPEQKLIFLYLHTSSYTSSCGIFKMHPKTMGFQIGLTHSPFESALKGLCAAFPDFVAADWATNEVALLQYPKQLLITANSRTLAIIGKDIQQVESQYLLRELIKRNSAGLSAPYLAQLRRLQMQEINNQNVRTLLDGDVAIMPDNEAISPEIETNKYKQIKGGKTLAPPLETSLTLEAIREEIPMAVARPGSKVSDVQANPNAYGEAAEFMLRKQAEMKATDFPGKFAIPYFLNEVKNNRWVSLLLPTTPQETHKWVNQHGAGIRAWALRQPQFERSHNAQPAAQVATSMRLVNPDKAPR